MEVEAGCVSGFVFGVRKDGLEEKLRNGKDGLAKRISSVDTYGFRGK
jgi:hypothetical protein